MSTLIYFGINIASFNIFLAPTASLILNSKFKDILFDKNKAELENVGQSKRAWYYSRDNENMHQSVQRESKAARDSAGILDASTLGKIDIKGSDATEFLNRVYTNAWSKLSIGKCRYCLLYTSPSPRDS